MTPDAINGLFECCGSVFTAISCWRLYCDKCVNGVSQSHIAFCVTWGCWNLFFYPSVGAWFSFYGGVALTVVNAIWVSMMLYYKSR